MLRYKTKTRPGLVALFNSKKGIWLIHHLRNATTNQIMFFTLTDKYNEGR